MEPRSSLLVPQTFFTAHRISEIHSTVNQQPYQGIIERNTKMPYQIIDAWANPVLDLAVRQSQTAAPWSSFQNPSEMRPKWLGSSFVFIR